MEATRDSREVFIRALSNYSECLKPYLRQAQQNYVASYYLVESQNFDMASYCKQEREVAFKTADAFKATLGGSAEEWTMMKWIKCNLQGLKGSI